jgi:hypothetical protein
VYKKKAKAKAVGVPLTIVEDLFNLLIASLRIFNDRGGRCVWTPCHHIEFHSHLPKVFRLSDSGSLEGRSWLYRVRSDHCRKY